MRSKEKWPNTEALVYSVEWITPTRYPGFYRVTYSYQVSGDRYTGTFEDFGSEQESYLHRDDTIRIEYDPARPEHSRYPLARAPRGVLPNGAMWVLRIFVAISALLIVLFGWRK